MIRLLVADDHAIVREGLKQIFAETADIVVEGQATNAAEVIDHIRARDWDLLLTDMSMPGRSGIELIKQVKAERPKLPVLVLSMHSEEQYAVRALKAGASGYLTKESASEQLVGAIRKVAAGGMFVTPNVAERLAMDLVAPVEDLPHTRLSDREYRIFQDLAMGKTPTAIAEELSLSVKTVSTHKTRILQKMQMQSGAELIHYALRHGLIGSANPD